MHPSTLALKFKPSEIIFHLTNHTSFICLQLRMILWKLALLTSKLSRVTEVVTLLQILKKLEASFVNFLHEPRNFLPSMNLSHLRGKEYLKKFLVNFQFFLRSLSIEVKGE